MRIEKSDSISLQMSGNIIRAKDLKQNMIVIGNYFFDVLKQELFYVNKQELFQVLISMGVETDPKYLEIEQIIAKIVYTYDYKKINTQPYQED